MEKQSFPQCFLMIRRRYFMTVRISFRLARMQNEVYIRFYLKNKLKYVART